MFSDLCQTIDQYGDQFVYILLYTVDAQTAAYTAQLDLHIEKRRR
jgi:hypothetical protein